MCQCCAMGASQRARKIREASEFDPSRLNRAISLPRDNRTSVFSWSLKDIICARNDQMNGQFSRAARMAESMRTDDACAVAYENRLAPQRCIKVALVPAKGGRSGSIAGEGESLFGQDGVGLHPDTLADVNGCFVNHGVAFGYNVATPRDDGTRVDFEMKYWPIEFVRWDSYRRVFVARMDFSTMPLADIEREREAGAKLLDPGPYGVTTLGTYEVPIIHGDGRWVIFKKHEIDPWKQEAAILPGCLVWARHAYALRDWAKGSVAHGSPKILGELPEGVPLQGPSGGDSEEALAFIALLRDLASADTPAGIRPFGSKTELMVNNSTAWQVWNELVQNAERSAARIYLGTDGTLGATGGAPGVDITALFGVAATKVEGDLRCIERAILTGVIEPWCAMNFGDSSLAPKRVYMLPDADEDERRASLATRRTNFFADITATRANGFEITQDYVDAVAEEYDVEAPTLPAEHDKAPNITLAPTDLAAVVTVNEGRASAGLGPMMLADGKPDPRGEMMIGAFNAAMPKIGTPNPNPTPAPPGGS